MGLVWKKRKCKALATGYQVVGCDRQFRPSRRDQEFCCSACRWTFHNEERRKRETAPSR